MRHATFAALALLPAVLAQAQTAPATQGDILAQERLEYQQFFERETQGLETLPLKSVHDLLSLTLDEGGFVKVTYGPSAPTTSMIVRFDDFPGLARLGTLPQAGEAARVFKHIQLDVPDTVVRQTEVLSTALSLQIALDVQTLETVTMISLVQNFGLGDEPSRVTLRADIGPEEGGEPMLKLTGTATSMRELIVNEPAIVMTYLLPVLEELKSSQMVLEPLEAMSVQVYAPLAAVDAESTQRIGSLLRALDSDVFAEREAAKKSLGTIATKDLPALLQFNASELSPEARGSIEAAIATAAPLTPERATALYRDPDFALTTLLVGDAELRKVAATQFQTLTGTRSKVDLQASMKTRGQQIEQDRAALAAATTQPGLLNR